MILLPGVTQLLAPLQEAQSPPRAAGLGARRLLYLNLGLTPIAFSKPLSSVQFSSVTKSCPTLCDPMNPARQASLSISNSRSSLKLMSIELVMPSSHLILCHPLLLLPPIPPSIRVFSNGSTLCMRWSKYWSFRSKPLVNQFHSEDRKQLTPSPSLRHPLSR